MLLHPAESAAKVIVIEPQLVDAMRSILPVQTKECIMETLGISANTWVKVKRGEAIRRSTAEHLVRRIEQLAEPRRNPVRRTAAG